MPKLWCSIVCRIYGREFHTFKKPVREGPKGGITTAYHRDRKERLHINKTVIGGPDISTNAKKVFLDIAKSDYIPYAYLYDIAEKHWFACDTCQDCGFALLRIKKMKGTENNYVYTQFHRNH